MTKHPPNPPVSAPVPTTDAASSARRGDRLLDLLTRRLAIDRRKVRVVVGRGIARLEGEVPDPETRRRADQMAARFAGVDHVDNRLRTEGRGAGSVKRRPGGAGD